MVRELIKNDVPELWKNRAKAGLCPVCGKHSSEFSPRMKVYCSVECRDSYANKYTSWAEVRSKILKRDGEKCAICNITHEVLEKNYKTMKEKLFHDFIKSNKDYIDSLRNSELLRLSKEFQKDYDNVMDDRWLFEHRIPWDERRELEKDLPSLRIDFHIDHIKAIVNGGDMWDEKNLQVLCQNCHVKKTNRDMKERTKGNQQLTKSSVMKEWESSDDDIWDDLPQQYCSECKRILEKCKCEILQMEEKSK